MSRRGLVALALLAGCRISALEGAEYAGPKNRCAIGCPTGSQCVEDRCVAETTSYPLTLEATPPSSSPYAAGVTFTLAVDDKRGGTRELKLPETAIVRATLDIGTPIPLKMRLERVGAVLGSAGASFEAKSAAGATSTPALSIPPGDYHVFIAPAEESDLALYPPVQLRGEMNKPLVVTFAPGPQELRVAYASAFRKVQIDLVDSDEKMPKPLSSPTEARDIKVIDETTGQLASTIAHTCLEPGKPLATSVTLTLAPELAEHRYTLRVEPAAKSCSAATPPVRATIDYDLQALDVEGRGNKVTVQVPVERQVLVSGLVRAYKEPIAIEGDVVLRSVKLDNDTKAGRASSNVTIRINRDGTFRDIVLPGTYRADIIPSADLRVTASEFAICVDCTVPSQDPMAKPGTRSAEFRVDGSGVLTFEVPRRVNLTADAVGFDGAMFTLGTWESSTSTSGSVATLTGTRLITRAGSGLVEITEIKKTGERWNVRGSLDPGVYDFVVRIPEASGYPWIVRPQLDVTATAKLDLGPMTVSAPVVFTGKVVDPAGAPIPRATIRARALIGETDPKKPALGAMLVGETRADENGNYKLIVPSALSVPKAEKPPT